MKSVNAEAVLKLVLIDISDQQQAFTAAVSSAERPYLAIMNTSYYHIDLII